MRVRRRLLFSYGRLRECQRIADRPGKVAVRILTVIGMAMVEGTRDPLSQTTAEFGPSGMFNCLISHS